MLHDLWCSLQDSALLIYASYVNKYSWPLDLINYHLCDDMCRGLRPGARVSATVLEENWKIARTPILRPSRLVNYRT